MKTVENLIIEQIESYNETLEEKVELKKGKETVLFGTGGVLTSIDFVNLIVDIEQAIEDEFDVSVTIASAKAMSQKNSPFRTVEALAAYIKSLIEEAK